MIVYILKEHGMNENLIGGNKERLIYPDSLLGKIYSIFQRQEVITNYFCISSGIWL